MTVWVVHPVKNNLDTLLVYGPIRYVTDRFIYADEIGDDLTVPDYFIINIAKAAIEFKPETDYMALVGDHLQLVLLAAHLIDAHQSFRLLRYDRIANGYFEVQIEV